MFLQPQKMFGRLAFKLFLDKYIDKLNITGPLQKPDQENAKRRDRVSFVSFVVKIVCCCCE